MPFRESIPWPYSSFPRQSTHRRLLLKEQVMKHVNYTLSDEAFSELECAWKDDSHINKHLCTKAATLMPLRLSIILYV